jgi:hypothetical protein
MPGCFQQRARACRETTGRDGIDKRIDFIVTATGKKPERADMDAGDRFFKLPEQGHRVKHCAIAADHHRKVNLARKCVAWNAIRFAREGGGRFFKANTDAMRFEGTAQIHKSGQ